MPSGPGRSDPPGEMRTRRRHRILFPEHSARCRASRRRGAGGGGARRTGGLSARRGGAERLRRGARTQASGHPRRAVISSNPPTRPSAGLSDTTPDQTKTSWDPAPARIPTVARPSRVGGTRRWPERSWTMPARSPSGRVGHERKSASASAVEGQAVSRPPRVRPCTITRDCRIRESRQQLGLGGRTPVTEVGHRWGEGEGECSSPVCRSRPRDEDGCVPSNTSGLGRRVRTAGSRWSGVDGTWRGRPFAPVSAQVPLQASGNSALRRAGRNVSTACAHEDPRSRAPHALRCLRVGRAACCPDRESLPALQAQVGAERLQSPPGDSGVVLRPRGACSSQRRFEGTA